MKKTPLIAMLSTFAAAATLAAEVMTFANFERNGIPVLIPEVQKYQSTPDLFKLPDRLTVAVPQGEELIAEQLADEIKRLHQEAADLYK